MLTSRIIYFIYLYFSLHKITAMEMECEINHNIQFPNYYSVSCDMNVYSGVNELIYNSTLKFQKVLPRW